MRRFRLLGYIFLLALATGCIRENMDDCFPEEIPGDTELRLLFSYTGTNGIDEFQNRVRSVEVILFDEEGFYLQQHSLSSQNLKDLQGINLKLDPGDYHVISWGNLSDKTSLSEMDSTTTIHTARLLMNSHETADSIYYAPRKTTTASNQLSLYQVTIPETGSEIQTVDFMTAYYTINTYVKGHRDYIGTTNYAPDIQMENLPEGYNFHLSPQYFRSSFRQSTRKTTVENAVVDMASFKTTHFDINNPINIQVVKSTTNDVSYSVNLQEILVANSYLLTMGRHVEIEVFIEFENDGQVHVTLSTPGWGSTGIIPG